VVTMSGKWVSFSFSPSRSNFKFEFDDVSVHAERGGDCYLVYFVLRVGGSCWFLYVEGFFLSDLNVDFMRSL